MKLWLISQAVNGGYDTYDAAVVAAETEEEARSIHPHATSWDSSVWAHNPEDVVVDYIGTAAKGTKKGVILASFNAG